MVEPTHTPPQFQDLLDGLDHLPDEFQQFLRALVRGLRAEKRIPLDLRVWQCVEPVVPTSMDGTWEYHLWYFIGEPDKRGPRRITGRWL